MKHRKSARVRLGTLVAVVANGNSEGIACKEYNGALIYCDVNAIAAGFIRFEAQTSFDGVNWYDLRNELGVQVRTLSMTVPGMQALSVGPSNIGSWLRVFYNVSTGPIDGFVDIELMKEAGTV